MPDPANNVVIFVVGDLANEPGELASLHSANLGWAQCFARGAAFLEHIANNFDARVDACLLLDLSVEDMPGLDVMAALRQGGCYMPAIVVASQADVRSAVRAMQAGAIDFFERPIAWDTLASCIRAALSQDRRRREAQSHRDNVRTRWNRLSTGERAVARMVCDGKASREICATLRLGRRTIENRRANIMVKMGVSNVAQLVRVLCSVGPGFPPPDGSPFDEFASDDSP
jgi:two-component system, LuxR family, response regulator FixJ